MKYPTIRGIVQGVSALVLYTMSISHLPSRNRWGYCTKQEYPVSLVISKIACDNSEHLLITSNNTFCTCTTQRSSVWWWLIDERIAWTGLHSGQHERERGQGRSKGCKYSREATVNAQIYIYFLIVSVVDHAKKWQKSNVTI